MKDEIFKKSPFVGKRAILLYSLVQKSLIRYLEIDSRVIFSKFYMLMRYLNHTKVRYMEFLRKAILWTSRLYCPNIWPKTTSVYLGLKQTTQLSRCLLDYLFGN